MAHEETWLTIREVCDTLKVNERTVRRWILGGELEAVDLGRKAGYRIAASEFNRFVQSRRKVPAFPPDDLTDGEDQ
jgi:excisionase family DNA binding protein